MLAASSLPQRPDRRATAPTDTLSAAAIDREVSVVPAAAHVRVARTFYPVPKGKIMRAVPYMPYLNFSPSAWVLPLKFDGGGYRAGGKAMFDSQGNLWVGDNFTVGWQAQDTLWQGNFTKFAPNGRPLSPITTGFSGGGFAGGTFGAAVDANDNVWLTSYGGMAISKFDKNGKSLAGPDGITFNGQLGLMQGVIVTPNGDVWVLGVSKSQLVVLPQGRPDEGPDHLRRPDGRAVQVVRGPFHLGIDQQNRIWVTNALRWARHALSRRPIRRRSKNSRPAGAAAASRSTAAATSGSRTASAAPCAVPSISSRTSWY